MNKGGCVLLNKDKTKVALVVRKENEYSFPKGHVEKGEKIIDCALRETEEETAKRELLEETGITVRLKTGFRESISYNILTSIPSTPSNPSAEGVSFLRSFPTMAGA